MKKKALFTILFATLALYGCGDGDDGTGGTGGSAGTGGSGGTAGTGGTGGGTGGSGGGAGGSGGTGGTIAGTEYTQDFESLVMDSPTALSDEPNSLWGAGWLVFKNVFTSGGMFKFGDGSTAPNSTAPTTPDGFSGIVSNEGGPDEGVQQLSIFSDYTCCPPGEGHFGTDLVVSDVFRERTITADDVGKTITFSFSAKRGNINDPAGTSTALAFIKTLDLTLLPNDPTTNFVPFDTTAISQEWMRYEISLMITADLVDQVLQFGFSSTASSFEPSGMVYDNILVVVAAP